MHSNRRLFIPKRDRDVSDEVCLIIGTHCWMNKQMKYEILALPE